MTNRRSNLGSLALCLATVLSILTACDKKEEPKTTSAPASAPSAPSTEAKAPPVPPAPTPPAPTAGSGGGGIQTQMGMTGNVEVDVLKANVQEGILTVTLAYRNTGKEAAKLKTIPIEDVYFISETEKKKYHVLKDSQDYFVGAPVARSKLGTETGFDVKPLEISPGGRTIVWFKFPAPPENVTVVNLVVPDIMPFDKLPVSR